MNEQRKDGLDPTLLRVEADKLRDEIQSLEVKKRRLDALLALLRTFESAAEGDSPSQDIAAPTKSESCVENAKNAAEPPVFHGVRPQTRKILEACWRELVRRGNKPILTRDLVDTLQNAGIEIGGANAVATLSAALSHNPHFKNCGRTIGWSIKKAE